MFYGLMLAEMFENFKVKEGMVGFVREVPNAVRFISQPITASGSSLARLTVHRPLCRGSPEG
jgi:hypothetical protein